MQHLIVNPENNNFGFLAERQQPYHYPYPRPRPPYHPYYPHYPYHHYPQYQHHGYGGGYGREDFGYYFGEDFLY